jgi:DNA-binding response OmpR family regulator
LVVESNLEIAGAVRAMLEQRKFGVHVATDGDRGLDALLDASYDAAVIDLVLPGRDGFAICRTARDQGIQTPVLILTTRDVVEERIRGRDAGADD